MRPQGATALPKPATPLAGASVASGGSEAGDGGTPRANEGRRHGRSPERPHSSGASAQREMEAAAKVTPARGSARQTKPNPTTSRSGSDDTDPTSQQRNCCNSRRSYKQDSGYSRYRSPWRPIGSQGSASTVDMQGAKRTRHRRQVVEPWRHHLPKRPWCGLVSDCLQEP